MIQIQTRRVGVLCIAATVNDDRDATVTWAFTGEGARRRCRILEREAGEL